MSHLCLEGNFREAQALQLAYMDLIDALFLEVLHPLGNVLIVLDKPGLGGLIVIGRHMQQSICAGILGVLGQAHTRALCGEDFYIWSGNDDQVVPIMSLGRLTIQLKRITRFFAAGPP